jgi:hypothetical protein
MPATLAVGIHRVVRWIDVLAGYSARTEPGAILTRSMSLAG